jgi:alpha-tubulin suppressor-like RCC1 family protein
MPEISAKGGTLYGCGVVGGKGRGCLNIPADNAGDCPYPQPIRFPVAKGTPQPKICAAAADTGLFAALDTTGRLYAFGDAHGLDSTVDPQDIAQDIISFDVGSKFVVAVNSAGTLQIHGTLNSKWKGGNSSLKTPVAFPDLGKITTVAACGQSVAAIDSAGRLLVMGDKINCGTEHDTDVFLVLPIPVACRFVSLGSVNGAAIGEDSGVYVWGDGLSGALGIGKRVEWAPPTLVSQFKDLNLTPVSVACTRGQANCKRMSTTKGIAAGQEGQRTHVVTSDGGLWIAGTTHKGMGADHLWKTMQPDSDHLSFYRVGGAAADAKDTPVPTGAAEDLKAAGLEATVARRMGMKDLSDFGKGGQTGYLTNVRIVSSQPVHIHSIALDSDGVVYSWGCGSNGRTGLHGFMRGPGGSKRAMKCYISTPSAVEELESKKVLFATAGKYWSLFVVESETLSEKRKSPKPAT